MRTDVDLQHELGCQGQVLVPFEVLKSSCPQRENGLVKRNVRAESFTRDSERLIRCKLAIFLNNTLESDLSTAMLKYYLPLEVDEVQGSHCSSEAYPGEYESGIINFMSQERLPGGWNRAC